MIYGIGSDLVDIERMENLLQRRGEAALRHLLSPLEFDAFRRAAHPAHFLAKRFAAKEAFSKALGTGLRSPVTLTAIAVEHDALGRPQLCFSPELAAFVAGRGVRRHHVSLSDERRHALAFVVLEG
nr:holo-ACP synthase [Paludibacterium yongneupense]